MCLFVNLILMLFNYHYTTVDVKTIVIPTFQFYFYNNYGNKTNMQFGGT